jgi:hypothetical protein
MRCPHRALRLVLAIRLVGPVGLVAAGLAQASSNQVTVCSGLGWHTFDQTIARLTRATVVG